MYSLFIFIFIRHIFGYNCYPQKLLSYHYASNLMRHFLIVLGVFLCTAAWGQSSKVKVKQEGILITDKDDPAPAGSAVLDVNSISKGVLFPRLSETQRNAIASPAEGLILYNTTEKVYQFYNGTQWIDMVMPDSIPVPPSNLVANAISSSQVDLTWSDNSHDETGFEIWRRDSQEGEFSLLTTVSSDVASYQDIGLISNNNYTYKIRSINGSAKSTYTLGITSATLKAVQIFTNWSDANGVYTLAVTGNGSFNWVLPDGTTQTGNSFTITENSGILNGLVNEIRLEAADFSVITDINWSGKSIVGTLDLSVLSPQSWVLDSNPIEHLVVPDLANTLSLRIRGLSSLQTVSGLTNSGGIINDINIYRNSGSTIIDLTDLNFGGNIEIYSFGSEKSGNVRLPSSNQNSITNFKYHSSTWTGNLDLSGWTGSFDGELSIGSSSCNGLSLPPATSMTGITKLYIGSMTKAYINTPNIVVANSTGNVTHSTFSRNGTSLHFDLTNFNFSEYFNIYYFQGSKNGVFTLPTSNSNNFSTFRMTGTANTSIDISGFTGLFTNELALSSNNFLTVLDLPDNISSVTDFNIYSSQLQNYYTSIEWGVSLSPDNTIMSSNGFGRDAQPRGNYIIGKVLENASNFSTSEKSINITESATWNINTNNPNLHGQGVNDASTLVYGHNFTITYWDGTQNITLTPPSNAPMAPSDLTITAGSSTQINLSWTDNSDNEADFVIERKTGPGGTWVEIIAVPANTSNYSDDNGGLGFNIGETYYYRVKSSNVVGESAWSPEINGTIFSPFISTWKTDNPGTSSDTQITLPLESSGNYNFEVDWGDGTSSSIGTYNHPDITHTYAASGTYTVSITGTIDGWRFNNGGDKSKLTEISAWGDLLLGNSGGYFNGCNNLLITATDVLNTSAITHMQDAFKNCSSLTTVPSMNQWDISSVTNMFAMFRSASSFNQNIANWDISNVTSTGNMFRSAILFNQDIGAWDVSSVTSMDEMFWGASTFNQNIDNWDVNNVTGMGGMFYGASAFNQNISAWNTVSVTYLLNMFRSATSFNQDISSWNVSSATNMSYMFRSATSFNQDISIWDVSGVTNMIEMFRDATSFDQTLGAWDITMVNDMSNMFYGVGLSTSNYDALLTGWESQLIQNNVTFHGGNSQYSSVGASARAALIDDHIWTITDGGPAPVPFVSTWKTDNAGSSGDTQVTLPLQYGTHDFVVDWGDGTSNSITSHNQAEVTHTYPVAGTYSITITGTIEGWSFVYGGDNAKLIEISQWGDLLLGNSGAYFKNCSNLTITATDVLNTSSITNMQNAFGECTSLTIVPSMNLWDISSVINMSHMFNGSSSFNQNIADWDVSLVTSMNSMFKGASAFNQDLGDWDVSAVTDMSYMFNSTSVFNQDLGDWDVSAVANMKSMFYGATAFDGAIGTWNVSAVTDMSSMFRSAVNFNQDIGPWNVGAVTTLSSLFHSASSFNQDLSTWNTASVTNMGYVFYGTSAFDQDLGSWNVATVSDMNNMLRFVNLSVSNYNSLLLGWEGQNVQGNVTLNASNSQYSSAAVSARAALIADHSWSINDGGELLAAPATLAASVNGSAAIDLTWTDNSSNETGFEVWRKTDIGGTYVLITTTTANATSYQDTPSMLTGDEYFYQVRATEGTYYSTHTAEASALIDYDVVTSSAFVNYTARGNRADNFDFSSGNLVSKWKDQGPNGLDLTQTSTSYQPTLYETGSSSFNSHAAIVTNDANDFLIGSSFGEWTFLHNKQSDYTIVLVGRLSNDINTSQVSYLINTHTSGHNIGMHIAHFGSTFSNSDYRNRIESSHKNGSSGRWLYSENQALAPGELYVLIVRFDKTQSKLTIELNSGLGKSKTISNHSFTASQSDPSSQLRLFNYVGSTSSRDNYSLAELGIWKENKSDEWVDGTLDWLYDYYSQ